jgi:hypothetical protein
MEWKWNSESNSGCYFRVFELCRIEVQYSLYSAIESYEKGSAEESLEIFRTLFKNKQENQLAVDGLFYGLPKEEFKNLSYEIAENNAVPQPSQKVTGRKVCLMGYVRRHPSTALYWFTSAIKARGLHLPLMIRFCTFLRNLQKNTKQRLHVWRTDFNENIVTRRPKAGIIHC